ncbi:MAG: cytochrome P450 [Microcystaceae cyanobacterium]
MVAAEIKHPVLPPGNLGLPFLGETLNFLQDADFAHKRRTKYGNIFKTRIFGSPTIFISTAAANRFLFTNENQYFVATWPKSVEVLLGPASLSLQTGTFHSDRRKLMFQAFQPRALASYIPKMEIITQRYLAEWEKQGNLTWYSELKRYTFDVASNLLIGTDYQSNPAIFQYFEDWSTGLFSIPVALPWTTFGKALAARKKLLQSLERIILERQKQSNLGEDALSLLLQAKDENGQALSLAELKDQILVLLFAGHETLTSAIASFCLLMAQNPDVMAKVRLELAETPLTNPLTLNALKSLTYLDQVLKEVLRFVPPVGGGFRKVIKTCEFDGYQFPEGWLVQYNIATTHKDGDFYQQPDRFDPDRFSPERAEDKQKSFGYIPFGGGLRECLGKEFARLEMKIFAIYLARNYDWKILPNQDLELTIIPSPRPKDGLKVDFFALPSLGVVNDLNREASALPP